MNSIEIKELALKVIFGLTVVSLAVFAVFVIFVHPGNIN